MRRLTIAFTSLLVALSGLSSISPANASTYDGYNGTISCSAGGSVLIEANVLSARRVWQSMIFDGEDYGYWSTEPSDCAGNLELPSGITSIGQEALSGSSLLTSVTIPQTVTSIGESAFTGSSITSIVIPQGVTSIGQGAFQSSSLTSISLPEGLTTIGGYAFYSARSLTSVNIPSTVTNIGYRAFAWNLELTSITVHSANANYASIDGVLYNKNLTTLLTYPAKKNATSFTIPSGVQQIGFAAFDHAKVLTSVTIPSSVTILGTYSFSGSGLQNVYFLGNAPSAQPDAFLEIPSGAKGYIVADATGFSPVGSNWNGLTITNTPAAPTPSNPRISSGALHTCTLVEGGVSCWGAGWWGQLGDGANSVRNIPVVAIPKDSGATSIGTGYSHSCATVNGGVKCWGENFRGKLGNGNSTDSNIPVIAIPEGSGATDVSAGGNQTCAVVAGGVKCWGEGIGNNPTVFIASGSGVTQVSVSAYHACAVIAGGVKCWGNNGYGQFGNGSLNETPTSTPVTSFVGVSGVTQVSAGVEQTCVVANGGLWCAGYNGAGQLGDGTTNLSALPVNSIQENSGVTSVALNLGNLVCATVAGGVKCWGQNWGGIGNGTTYSQTPVSVIATGSGVTGVSVSMKHGCAIASSFVRCWGNNEEGELGNGSFIASATPVTVRSSAAIPVTVNYSLEGGSGNPPMQSEVQSGSSFVVAGTPTRAAYTFLGWSDGVALFQSGSSYTVGDSAVTLTAVWSANTYSLSFNSNGGSAVSTIAFTLNESISAPPAPTRSGYTFAGWSATDGGSSVTFPYSPNVAENVTLHAAWTVSLYTVTYHYNSATSGNSSVFATYSPGRTAIRLPNPIRNGYYFGGWYVDSLLTTKIGDAGNGFSPTGNVASLDAYAKWVKKSFTRLIAPVVNGHPKVGFLLSTTITPMSSGVSYSYQWLRDGVPIESAVTRTYQVKLADLNTNIQFRVCGSKLWFDTTCLVSNSSVVTLGDFGRIPSVGLKWTSLKVGAVISGKAGSWDAGVALSYSWFRDGVAISNENQATYTVTEADRGHAISFRVLAQKPGYKNVTRTSVMKVIP